LISFTTLQSTNWLSGVSFLSLSRLFLNLSMRVQIILRNLDN
jgi:hypothetical protein